MLIGFLVGPSQSLRYHNIETPPTNMSYTFPEKCQPCRVILQSITSKRFSIAHEYHLLINGVESHINATVSFLESYDEKFQQELYFFEVLNRGDVLLIEVVNAGELEGLDGKIYDDGLYNMFGGIALSVFFAGVVLLVGLNVVFWKVCRYWGRNKDDVMLV